MIKRFMEGNTPTRIVASHASWQEFRRQVVWRKGAYAHLVGVHRVAGNVPDHGIIGTASLGATIARFDPRRRATCAAFVLSQVEWPRSIMTVAACHRARRWLTSPDLVAPPETSRWPD
jgi:hypothetical protein